jgi:hypothetical protein
MSYAHGCVEGLRQARHDIRQPIAGVLALAGAAPVRGRSAGERA